MTQILTLDGMQELVSFPEDNCCAPSICEIDVCALICNCIQLLPSGPMWDRQKELTALRYSNLDCHGVACGDATASDCASLADYAAYTGRVLHYALFYTLWPAIRESDPRTAFTTLDQWLDRVGWQDCYSAACRNPMLGKIAPFEIQGECGPVYCGTSCASTELTLAVKRGIVLALVRLAMRPIRNLANLNWIIEPLGAVLTVRESSVPESGECAAFPQFNLCPNADKTIESAPANGDCGFIPKRISAACTSNCEGFGLFYPGVAAAFCILISMFPLRTCCDPELIVYEENC